MSKIRKSACRTLSRSFSQLIWKLAAVLMALPPQSGSGIVRTSKEPDWTMEAINSPTGDLAQALFDDPLKSNLEAGAGLPGEWQEMANQLLSLPNDLRRHALVIFSVQSQLVLLG
ncbi:hypothetical protein LP421_25655 [Rhizobium sp. RCAM05350]|nr:hypothetical protein LP421_25655 [Rhizobium sp. RCAM05350]